MTALAVLLAVAWAAVAFGAMARRRPPPKRARQFGVVPAVPAGSVRRRGVLSTSTVAGVGRVTLRLVPSRRAQRRGARDDAFAQRVGGSVLAGLAALVLAPAAAPLAAGVAWFAPVVLDRRRIRRKQRAVLDGLPEIVDLLGVAVGTGLIVGQALEAVSRRGSGPLADELGGVLRRARLGLGLADALDELPRRVGDEIRPLSAALAACERYGSPVGPALTRIAEELRADRRRRAEEAARRVPVKMIFPLVGCVLPAFALLTVAPLVAGAAGALRLSH